MKVALVLHGWPQHRISDHFLIKYLKKKDFDVITPDLFGHGFDFSPQTIHQRVLDKINGGKPDLIAGISLGGMVLPYIAKDYPEAKLIFISSGPSLRARPKFFHFLLTLFQHKPFLKFASLAIKLPPWLLAIFYRMGSPYSGAKEGIKEYEEDMSKNIDFIKDISLEKEIEIMKFVMKANTSEILSGLKNESLIFNGKDDLLMPAEGGKKLHKLLRNSKLIINDGEHFDVFTKEDLPVVDRFLSKT